MGAGEEFVQRGRRFGLALLVTLLMLPGMAIAAGLEAFAGIRQGPIPAAIVVGVALAVYFATGDEHRVVIDGRGMRFVYSRFLFGVRSREEVLWEIPLEALDHAREVTTRSPSSHGGWNTAVVLHFPQDRKILEVELGMKDAPSSPYNALVASLQRRLGDRFTTEQVT